MYNVKMRQNIAEKESFVESYSSSNGKETDQIKMIPDLTFTEASMDLVSHFSSIWFVFLFHEINYFCLKDDAEKPIQAYALETKMLIDSVDGGKDTDQIKVSNEL